VLKSIVATKNNDTRALVCFVPQHNPPMTATAQARAAGTAAGAAGDGSVGDAGRCGAPECHLV
jgi:hypothetical protein